MDEPKEMFKVTIRAMDNGQLIVDWPPDQFAGQRLGIRLLDAAKEVIEQQQKKLIQPLARSAFDVRPYLGGKQL